MVAAAVDRPHDRHAALEPLRRKMVVDRPGCLGRVEPIAGNRNIGLLRRTGRKGLAHLRDRAVGLRHHQHAARVAVEPVGQLHRELPPFTRR